MSLLDTDAFGKTAGDYDQDTDRLSEETETKIKAKNSTLEDITISFSQLIPDRNFQQSKELRESRENFDAFRNGIKSPHNYDGMLKILANGHLIYKVRFGRITKDTFGLALDFQYEHNWEKKFDAYNRYCQGLEVFEAVKKFTEIAGKRQTDNSLLFEGDDYAFFIKDKQLQVSYRDVEMDEKMEILNNEGFTPYTASEDTLFIKAVKQKMDGFEEQCWQSEQEELKPKM